MRLGDEAVRGDGRVPVAGPRAESLRLTGRRRVSHDSARDNPDPEAAGENAIAAATIRSIRLRAADFMHVVHSVPMYAQQCQWVSLEAWDSEYVPEGCWRAAWGEVEPGEKRVRLGGVLAHARRRPRRSASVAFNTPAGTLPPARTPNPSYPVSLLERSFRSVYAFVLA
jgi:hypothetical protein